MDTNRDHEGKYAGNESEYENIIYPSLIIVFFADDNQFHFHLYKLPEVKPAGT